MENEPATATLVEPAAPMVTLTSVEVASALSCTEPPVECSVLPSARLWIVPFSSAAGLALMLREGVSGAPPM